MLNIDNIFIKYINSSEKWILAIPVIEAGQIKLRCFMTGRNELTGTFQNCYTYNVSFNLLTDFFSYKSHGQAYNELIKYKKTRTGFFGEASHTKGNWTMSDIRDTILNGRSALVCEAINKLMSLHNRSFTLEAITKSEKEARKKEKQE